MNITDLPERMQTKIRVVESGCWQWMGAHLQIDPAPATTSSTLYLPQRDDDPPVVMRERAHMCARCGSLVADKQRHYRWHRAVDTGATNLLPSDTKDLR